MDFKCDIESRSAQPVIALRRTTSANDLSAVFGESYGLLGAYLAEVGEAPAGPPYACYFNMDMENLDVEIGFPVGSVLPGKGEVYSRELPQGEYASCLFIGTYREIESAYDALGQWVEEQGRKASGEAYEYYLNDPGDTAPEDLQTLIVFPLE